MNLLHYVEGDGDDAASVLTHSHTPGRMTPTQEVNIKEVQNVTAIFIANKGTTCNNLNLHSIYLLAERNKEGGVGGLTRAMSGSAQTG